MRRVYLSLVLTLLASGAGAVEMRNFSGTGLDLTPSTVTATNCIRLPAAGTTLQSGCGGTLTTLDSLTVTNAASVGGQLTATGGVMSAGQVTIANSTLTVRNQTALNSVIEADGATAQNGPLVKVCRVGSQCGGMFVEEASTYYGLGLWGPSGHQATFERAGMGLGTYINQDIPEGGLVVSGKVGIGTVSPGTKLHVSSGVLTVDGTDSQIKLYGDGIGSGVILLPTEAADRPNVRFVDANNGVSGTSSSVSLWAYGAKRLHANATGVGIGTASPATTLDVNGSAQFGSGATKSTTTAAGLIVPRAATLAQIQAFTPTANELGGYFTCSNCADAYSVCQATGASIQGFRLGFSGTSECK